MSTHSCIRVLSVDDHPLIRSGIAYDLEGLPDMKLVGSVSTGTEALMAYRRDLPDILLVDLRLPDFDGVEVVTRIRSEFPNARCVILTTFSGDVQVSRALRAGAAGYLLKSALDRDLIDTIRRVNAGHRCIPMEVASELAAYLDADALSEREIAVLKVVAEGNSNKIVADRLSISEDTVKGHMRNVMMKLCANDRTHAVLIAMKRGYLDA